MSQTIKLNPTKVSFQLYQLLTRDNPFWGILVDYWLHTSDEEFSDKVYDRLIQRVADHTCTGHVEFTDYSVKQLFNFALSSDPNISLTMKSATLKYDEEEVEIGSDGTRNMKKLHSNGLLTLNNGKNSLVLPIRHNQYIYNLLHLQ